MNKEKLLIIRFSSFGDIVQCFSAAKGFKDRYPQSEIHWVVRSDQASILQICSYVDKIHSYDRKTGLKGLLQLAFSLRQEKWSHIYDAHNNLRSLILTKFLNSKHFVRRSKNRWKRFLQFQLGKKVFPQPYEGRKSYVEPMKKWDVDWTNSAAAIVNEEKIHEVLKKHDLKKSYVAVMPSAAWPMKRWPVSHFEELIKSIDHKVILLGGKEDRFVDDLCKNSNNAVSLAGRLSLLESAAIVAGAEALICADTGLLHVADQLNKKCIALIGPSAFGYPSSKQSLVLETRLSCKPCSKDGRGRCKNNVYQKCLVDIKPDLVKQTLDALLRK